MTSIRRKYIAFLILAGISFSVFSCKSPSTENNKSETISSVELNELPSWSPEQGNRIKEYVQSVTDSSSQSFIPVMDRIAVFDNDGTLWPEQPLPTQLYFAIDNLKALSANNPQWKSDPVLNGVINNDLGPLKESGMNGLFNLVNASHTGQTTTEFRNAVRAWIDTTTNPKFNRPYKELLYQPMLELLDYLRANDFKVFIVSGGGADFMRVFAEEAYGIPPYQVIGSYGELKYEVIDGKPVISKVSGDIYVDDKAGKPAAIHRFIGKIPVFCGGNSDGDQAMMQYTSSSPYKSMCLILHHTDSIREYKYDLHTMSGHLETALTEAAEKNWMVVDMENDFIKIFP